MSFLIDVAGDFFYDINLKEEYNKHEYHGKVIFWHAFLKNFSSRMWFVYEDEIIITEDM